MPRFSREHEAGITFRISSALDLLQGLIEDALIEGLPFDIEALEAVGELERFARIIAHEKPEPVGGISNPSRCIEPRAEHESQMPRNDLLTREAGGFNQCPYSNPATVSQQLESVADKYPVLPLKRYHVSDGGKRHEVEQMKREISWETESRNECLHELEGNSRPTECIGT